MIQRTRSPLVPLHPPHVCTISPDSFAARNLRAKVEGVVTSDGLDLPLLPDSSSQVLSACNSEECDSAAWPS